MFDVEKLYDTCTDGGVPYEQQVVGSIQHFVCIDFIKWICLTADAKL